MTTRRALLLTTVLALLPVMLTGQTRGVAPTPLSPRMPATPDGRDGNGRVARPARAEASSDAEDQSS